MLFRSYFFVAYRYLYAKERVWCAINNTKEETNMAVLAVPMDKTFEVAVDKVENFDKKAKEHSGKHLLQDRLKKHNKGDVEWDLKK